MRTILFIISSIITIQSFAQTAIGTTMPHTSAALEISSTDKGILLPRMSELQMISVQNPAEGLIIFNTNTKSFWYYKTGEGWKDIALSLPFSQNINETGNILAITNSSTSSTQPTMNVEAVSGNAIYGKSGGTWSGVFGENNSNGKGLSGLNTGTGHGVHARGMNGTAIFADILSGSGTAARFRQTSLLGKALETEGRIRIFGGNMNPDIGYVLTSIDNVGTARWQPSPTTNTKISFEERGMAGGGLNVLNEGYPGSKYHPGVELYDPNNNFNTVSQVPSSTFIAPVAGLYTIQAAVTFPRIPMNQYDIDIMLERNGSNIELANITKFHGWDALGFRSVTKSLTLSYSTTTHLYAGDRISVIIEADKEETSGTVTFSTAAEQHFITGTLVYAD